MARPMFPVIFSLPWKKACEKKKQTQSHPDRPESEVRLALYRGGEENYMLLVLRVTVRD